MSKIASTLASLLLIASSIGVNIARYPHVGRPVDSGSAADPAKVAEPLPSTNPADGLETAKSSHVAITARPESTNAQSETAVRTIEDRAPADRSPAAGQAISPPQSAVTILDVRPMIPVATLRAASAAQLPAGNEDVRRLPPVDPSVLPIGQYQSAAVDRAEPYPATATP